MGRPGYTPPSGGATAANRRLRLADATLYDPGNTVVSATQNAAGKMSITVTGGRISDDPGAAATWIWPVTLPGGDAPNPYARWDLRTLLCLLDLPALLNAGDTWVVAGICTRNDPNGASWNARGYGFQWLAANGGCRAKAITVSGGGAPTVSNSGTSQPTLRTIEQAWARMGVGQAILPICAILCDGSNQRTGTDLTTTNSVLTLGAGVELGIFLSVGRNLLANAANDTVYVQLDSQEVVEWTAAAGGMNAGRVLNVLPLGDSITQGTGWTEPKSGAQLCGWRRKLEDEWLAVSGLPLLRFHGTNTGSNSVMVLGRGQHEGRSGFTSAQIDTAIIGYLDALTNVMDVVVIGLGTNDAQGGVVVASYLASMQSIINKIRAHANAGVNCKIVVSTIPPLLNTTHEARAATYRAQLGTLTNVYTTVDDVTGINTTTGLADGVHPTEATYLLMAQRRLAILRLL